MESCFFDIWRMEGILWITKQPLAHKKLITVTAADFYKII